MKAHTEITVSGTLGGSIWMPAVTCGKYFELSNQQYPFGGLHGKATLRDMVLRATNDGAMWPAWQSHIARYGAARNQ